MDFTGKTILVTGGTRGIGRATVLTFAERNAKHIVATYRTDEAAAKSIQDELSSRETTVTTLKADVSNEEEMARVFDEIESLAGGLDVAVANAGIWERAPIDQMTMEAYDRVMNSNMTGSFLVSKYASRLMKRQHAGAIVFVSSTAGQRGEAFHSHYAASKGAQISFTKSLAPELAAYGIRVNCVAPGWVDTDMTRETLMQPSTGDEIRRVIPLGRPATPQEIAKAIVFLASPEASFITGEVLNVNGGAVLCG